GTFPLLHSSQFAPKGDNRGFFASRAFDEAIDKATLATTDPARLGALREAQQIAINEAPYIFLISPNMIVGTSKKVHDVTNLPLELTYVTEKSSRDKWAAGVTAYITRRLLPIAPVLVGVSIASFALLQLVPGDPAMILAGQEATEEVLTRIRHEHGLDQPLPVQFLVYLR